MFKRSHDPLCISGALATGVLKKEKGGIFGFHAHGKEV
jgi:hypothetical protein